jgi:transcriptional regulator with PAS, ATPase and Fis domain
MLHLDRYLRGRRSTLDLATGRDVWIEPSSADSQSLTLFDARDDRTLIDEGTMAESSVRVWERWRPPTRCPDVQAMRDDFVEMLQQARHGAPRALDLQTSGECYAYARRVLAREARTRGWIPVGVEVFAHVGSATRRQALFDDRSLVLFVERRALSASALAALVRLARRDTRPHILVRPTRARDRSSTTSPVPAPLLREQAPAFVEDDGHGGQDLAAEARARWAFLLQETTHGMARDDRVLDLARVLAARDQGFEARALATRLQTGPPGVAAAAARVVQELEARAAARAGEQLTCSKREEQGEWDMVDDFVAVLQLCQEIEDEHLTLARVGAFLRDRLQASSVAFVARDGRLARTLARIGSDVAAPTLAEQAIETGVAVTPCRREGPVESACPVRHAADVIGAIWCRWSAGVAVADRHAATLMTVAAAATAPTIRLALARQPPSRSEANPIPELVGESPAIRAVRDQILRAAASPFAVVIEGESGVGKELVARAIHRRSARRDQPFCPVNCAALVDELVEAELFGHARGAFTGATADRKGVFEEASGGTLFLDEIAELSGRVQAKLLRALQEGEIKRLGESLVRRVDVRVVAATNRPLARQVADGAFRADLWYRLDVIRVALPPLRERLDDVPMLVDHLWQALAARTGQRARLSATALAALSAYDWPGNVRELQNVLASMLVATPRAGVIGASAVPAHVARMAAVAAPATLAAARRQFEERFVRAALARAGGRTATAARDLGLSRQGLSKLLGRLGILEPRPADASDAHVQ